MKQVFAQLWEGKRDLLLVAGVVGILVILFTPIPPALLDLLLILNLSTALLILLVTFYTDTPLKFSTFPSILLIITLFRLALNITSTRLILDGAFAGQVINGIGEYVIGGNYIVGFVVFLILVVVQYVVITAGAQRVAEVAARFTLDSMPGKQMAIDADMNMGLIDEKEARRRREQIEREANFYGAMDGATKFVKGDAVAGIIITVINMVGGFAIGMVQLGMSWGEAAKRFTLLTVGDGIVTQIPALIIAVATGIIITRAATDAQLGREISRQVLSNSKTLMIVAVALFGLLLMPGLPKLPVAAVLVATVLLAWWASRQSGEQAENEEVSGQSADAGKAEQEASDDYYRMTRVEPLELRLGKALAQKLLKDTPDFGDRLSTLRKQFAQESGVVLPAFALSETAIGEDRYEIWIDGGRVGHGELDFERLMAINPGGQRAALEGRSTKDPAYGLPAQWIEQTARQFARAAGYTLVDAETVLMTHLSEVLKRHAPELLSRAETERMIGRVRIHQSTLVDELVPVILSYSEIQKVFQQLLREHVSLRGLEAILEVLVDAGKTTKNPDELAERVRERLGASICQRLVDDQGELHVLTLAPELERALSNTGDGRNPLLGDITQLDAFLRDVGRQADAMVVRNLTPVLLSPARLRRQLRSLVHRSYPHIAIIGLNEVPSTTAVRSAGSVAAVA